MNIAFFLLRPHRIAHDLVLDRSTPDFESLKRIRSPESFMWKILSYAARTFSACILFLPSQLAFSAAIAYLYCRILDTYEDLVSDPLKREAFLEAFTHRFKSIREGYAVEPAPPIDDRLARNASDRIYTLLVNRCRLIDVVFLKLKAPFQRIIVDLVTNMARGMIWSSQTFEKQGNVLQTSEQLSRYCHNVLGNPTIFAVRLMNLYHGKGAELPPYLHHSALQTGEFIQLANITRDIENDLKRGIAYHPSLKEDLGRGDFTEPGLAQRLAAVRETLLIRALSLAPAYLRIGKLMEFPRLSLGRGSLILMLLFTERYFRSCAQRIQRVPWPGPETGLHLILNSMLSVVSGGRSKRILKAAGDAFAEFVSASHPHPLG